MFIYNSPGDRNGRLEISSHLRIRKKFSSSPLLHLPPPQPADNMTTDISGDPWLGPPMVMGKVGLAAKADDVDPIGS